MIWGAPRAAAAPSLPCRRPSPPPARRRLHSVPKQPPPSHPPCCYRAASPQQHLPSYSASYDGELPGGAALYTGPVGLPPVTHIGDVIPMARPTSSTTSSEAPRRPSSSTAEDEADSGCVPGWMHMHQRPPALVTFNAGVHLHRTAQTLFLALPAGCRLVSPLPRAQSGRRVAPTKTAAVPSGPSSRSSSRAGSGGAGSVAGSSASGAGISTATSKGKLPRCATL